MSEWNSLWTPTLTIRPREGPLALVDISLRYYNNLVGPHN